MSVKSYVMQFDFRVPFDMNFRVSISPCPVLFRATATEGGAMEKGRIRPEAIVARTAVVVGTRPTRLTSRAPPRFIPSKEHSFPQHH